MQITMTKTRRVSEDGYVTRYLEKDATYEVMDTAARGCIADGSAFEPHTRSQRHYPNPLGFDTNPETLFAKDVIL